MSWRALYAPLSSSFVQNSGVTVMRSLNLLVLVFLLFGCATQSTVDSGRLISLAISGEIQNAQAFLAQGADVSVTDPATGNSRISYEATECW